MATGKRPLRIPTGAVGEDRETLVQVLAALTVLRAELASLPGVGELLSGEAIAAGNAVYISGSTLFNADAATNQPAIGISVSSASAAGTKVRYILGMGFISTLSGLTPNKSVYLGNAGGVVYAIPGAGMKQSLGWTLSATEMFVTISQPF